MNLAPYAWKGAGVLAFIALAWGAWWSSRPDGELPASWKQPSAETAAVVSPPTVSADLDSATGDVGVLSTSIEPLPSVDTAAGQEIALGTPVGEPVPQPPRAGHHTQLIDTAPPPLPAASPPVADRAPSPRAETPPPRPRSVSRPNATAPKVAARPRRTARWVNVVARTWIPVRANANGSSRVVASIGPDTRVQLGESRGAWRRIRTRGVSGWVEQRLFASR